MNLNGWLGTMTTVLRILKDPTAALPGPPASQPTIENAQMLLKVRQLLGVQDMDQCPANETGKRLAAVVASDYVKVGIEERASQLSTEVDRAIAQAIEGLNPAEVHALGLIRSMDFLLAGDDALHLKKLSVPSGEAVVYLGRIAVLPADHPLHEAKPDLGWFKAESRVYGAFECVLLGPPAPAIIGGSRPRAFYSLSAALALTTSHRLKQVAIEVQRRQDQINEKRREEVAWQESPLGQLEHRLKVLEQMKPGSVPATVSALLDPITKCKE